MDNPLKPISTSLAVEKIIFNINFKKNNLNLFRKWFEKEKFIDSIYM